MEKITVTTMPIKPYEKKYWFNDCTNYQNNDYIMMKREYIRNALNICFSRYNIYYYIYAHILVYTNK